MQLVGREKKCILLLLPNPRLDMVCKQKKNAREINGSDARLLREREEKEKE